MGVQGVATGVQGVKAGGKIVHVSHGGFFGPALEPLLRSLLQRDTL